MSNLIRLSIAILLLCFASVGVGEEVKFYNPSFNCAKVKKGSVEYRICTDEKLAKLDWNLSNIYNNLKTSDFIDLHALKEEQKAWLKNRNECKNAKCIVLSYENKISYLLDENQKIDYILLENVTQEQETRCLNKAKSSASRKNCVHNSMELWSKEIKRTEEYLIFMINYFDDKDFLYSLYNRYLSYDSKTQKTLDKLLKNIYKRLEGSLMLEVITLQSQENLKIKFKKLDFIKRNIFLLKFK